MKTIRSLALLLSAATAAFAQAPASQIANLSSRGVVGAGAGSLIAGFVVSGSAPKTVLVRGTGPGLAAFGDTSPATLINVNVYDGAGNLIASNSGTMPDPTVAAASASVGAFTQSSPGDSALVATLAPGSYTVEIAPSGANSPAGDALLEVYDADAPGSGSSIVNLSTRSQVGAASGAMISGFVVNGTSAKMMLIRSVGADLAAFGVANAAPVVGIKLYDTNGKLVAANSGYLTSTNAADVAQAAAALGAFPLADAGDSAVLVSLPPGAYTVELVPAAADAPAAVGMIEIYDADSTVAPAPAPVS